MQILDLYQEVISLLSSRYEEVSGYDFYRDIFPKTERSDEQHTDFSSPNPIYLCFDSEKGYKVRHVMYCDTWEDDYMEFIEQQPNCVCGGLVYRQKRNLIENAQRMNALIFDLDGVGEHELRNLLHRFTLDPGTLRSLPVPTYLVASGTGVHLYYVFYEPIDLFPNIKLQMKSLKHDLTFKIWEYKATSKEKQIQYQSINQGFRMVGSINEKHGNEVVAFRTGERVSIDYLNKYVIQKNNRVDLQKRFKPSKMTREEAKLTYPEWYERVIIKGDKRPKKWDIAGKVHGDDPFALYHWWIRQVGEVKGGHRYFFLMCMAIYAAKCDVPKAKLKEDLATVYQELKEVEHTNPMKPEDIKSALDAYSKEYYNFTIADIEKITEIRIERNKRNYQKQADHLEEARAIRDLRMKRQGRIWDENNGRPKGCKDKKPRKNKREEVKRYRERWPKGDKADCARITRLDPKTIRKWWDA